jgi:hypothetical protein
MTAGTADEYQNNGPVYCSPEIACALAGAKKAVLLADSDYGRFLAIRDGRAELVRAGDDDSDAISDSPSASVFTLTMSRKRWLSASILSLRSVVTRVKTGFRGFWRFRQRRHHQPYQMSGPNRTGKTWTVAAEIFPSFLTMCSLPKWRRG